MNIIELGVQLIQEKFGLDIDGETIQNALTSLLGNEGQFDIQDLVSQFMADGSLQNVVGSWLGDGGNESISVSQLTEILGSEKIGEFASQLGISDQIATEGLTDIIPQLLDKVSGGGALLENGSADLGSVMDFAKKLF